MLKSGKPDRFTREININGLWYGQTVFYVPASQNIRFYSYNITERKKREELLLESEERYRRVVETALDGLWVTDLSGRLLHVNDSYCHMTGYTRQELLAMHISDIEAMEKPEETVEHVKKVIERGYDRFETRHKCRDGRIIDIEVSTRYLEIGGGQLIVFARDITERKKVEQALRESQRDLSHAQAVAYIGNWRLDIQHNDTAVVR